MSSRRPWDSHVRLTTQLVMAHIRPRDSLAVSTGALEVREVFKAH